MKENEDKEKEGELQFTLQGMLFPYAALKFTCALWILFREARITIRLHSLQYIYTFNQRNCNEFKRNTGYCRIHPR